MQYSYDEFDLDLDEVEDPPTLPEAWPCVQCGRDTWRPAGRLGLCHSCHETHRALGGVS